MDDLRIPPVPGNARRLMTPPPAPLPDRIERAIGGLCFFAGIVVILLCLDQLLRVDAMQVAGGWP
jgi:hypothetical protein